MENKDQDKQIEKICFHVETMNKEFGDFKISNTAEHIEIKTDLTWIKKSYWVVFTASVGALIAIIIK